jgi:Dr1-associated corepressor
MSEEHDAPESSYRPSSPDLSGLTTLTAAGTTPNSSTNTGAPLPRLTRIPSYHAPDPNLPPGYSFSPRGSYDASPFFSPSITTPTTSYFGSRPQPPSQFSYHSSYSPQTFRTPSLPGQHSPPSQNHPLGHQSSSHFNPPPPPPQFPASPSRPPLTQTFHQAPLHQSPTPFSPYGDMPRTRRQQAAEGQQDPDYVVNSPPRNVVQPKVEQPLPVQPLMPAPPTDPTAGIDVRTKFPVARIKRIMQADEDVGKVAQATPTAVGKYS